MLVDDQFFALAAHPFVLGISPCKPIKTDEARISRRLTQRMKQIEALPRRAQDKVIATLELALKGARN